MATLDDIMRARSVVVGAIVGACFVVGAGIGLATALLAPYTYATLTEWHFGVELPSTARLVDRLIPVTAPTGFVAGALLGPTPAPRATVTP